MPLNEKKTHKNTTNILLQFRKSTGIFVETGKLDTFFLPDYRPNDIFIEQRQSTFINYIIKGTIP